MPFHLPVRHPTRRRREQGCACGTVLAALSPRQHQETARRPFVLVAAAKVAADMNWGSATLCCHPPILPCRARQSYWRAASGTE